MKYTQIVDNDGKPLVVLHGTDTDFDRFDAAYLGANTDDNADMDEVRETAHLGFWFNVGGDLSRAYCQKKKCLLYIEEPYYVDSLDDLHLLLSADSAEELKERLISEGYDGIVVQYDYEFGGTSYVAFEPEQIVIL